MGNAVTKAASSICIDSCYEAGRPSKCYNLQLPDRVGPSISTGLSSMDSYNRRKSLHALNKASVRFKGFPVLKGYKSKGIIMGVKKVRSAIRHRFWNHLAHMLVITSVS